MKIQVADNLKVDIIPNDSHEFLMTSQEVAKGYGVDPSTLRGHKHTHKDELIEGKHFINGVGKTNAFGNQSVAHHWTKRGIVRLGFFIKSERAKLFRDWAEDLMIETIERASEVQSLIPLPENTPRKHNRLTQERLVDILADVARIEDKELRLSIVDKLVNK
jgi:hypothetical protein